MRTNLNLFYVAISIALISSMSVADGYLWLSAEIGPLPISIWRYNLQTGLVDLNVVPTDPETGQSLCEQTGVCQTFAATGTTLFLGNDGSCLLARADAQSGQVSEVGEYVPCNGGNDSFEDGAIHPIDGTLWRTMTENEILQSTYQGVEIAQRPVAGTGDHLQGLEWSNEGVLYATVLAAARFGIIEDPFGTPFFTEIDLSGIPDDHDYDGLALDRDADVLYMATRRIGQAYLWIVDPVSATATPVATLPEVGYPNTGISDGLSWVAYCPTDLDDDQVIGPADLAMLLAHWGPCTSGAQVCVENGDLDGNGEVDAVDLSILLNNWGPCSE